MDGFNALLTGLGDLLVAPFRWLGLTGELLILSAATGAVMVWLFGKTTNQQRVRFLKNQIKGRLLEMWLFRDSVRLTLRAQGKALRAIGGYALASLRAVAALMVPVALIMIQMQARYGWKPLEVGDDAIVTVTFREHAPLEAMSPKITPSAGLRVETPLLRSPDEKTSEFRVGVVGTGPQEIKLQAGEQQVTKVVSFGDRRRIVSPTMSQRWSDRLLYPIEHAPPPGAVSSVSVKYPEASVGLFGWECHWVWVFLVVSIVSGLALKGVFGVEV